MMFTAHYQSPLGEILLAADEVGLTGLWFDRAKYMRRAWPRRARSAKPLS